MGLLQLGWCQVGHLMARDSAGATINHRGLVIAFLGLLLSDPARAQVAPVEPPGNALSRMVPYEQGMADIRARDERRNKAVVPRTTNADDGPLQTVPPAPVLEVLPPPATSRPRTVP